jgi:hypothetical protein
LAGDLDRDADRCARRECHDQQTFVRSNEGHSDGSQTEGDRIRATDDATAKLRRASRSADGNGFDSASAAQARSGGAPRQARLEQPPPSGIVAAQVGNREAQQLSLIGANLVR